MYLWNDGIFRPTWLSNYFPLCNTPLTRHASRIINTPGGGRHGNMQTWLDRKITEAENPFYLQAAKSINANLITSPSKLHSKSFRDECTGVIKKQWDIEILSLL